MSTQLMFSFFAAVLVGALTGGVVVAMKGEKATVTIKRLAQYTTPLAPKLYLMSFVVALASTLLAVAVDSSTVFALGLSAAGLMWWPLIRDLAPVVWSVVIHGRWPTRNT
ncbi:hypothetical protein [Pseudomonas koreensis]|uniref:hypothetical protein n=1 Tax=Pseudomonas koreensis TaxID=198620 RepID=UPI003207A710